MDPIIAIVGNVGASADAEAAAVELGRELAKAGFRILVYGSDPKFLEAPVVKGYVASESARPRSIQVRYPLHQQKPGFPEQLTHGQLFDWRPDSARDWEMSFYQSLKEVDGILLVGGAQSTLIGGLVAMGHRTAVVALASFGGSAAKIWESLRPGRDLPSADDISLMARPQWSPERAAECAKVFQEQLARRDAEVRQRLIDERRREASIKRHAAWALVLFVAAVVTVPLAWGQHLSLTAAIWLLFMSPLLAGVAGSTIRLVFDLREGSLPLSRESALTTAALGVVAGGVAGLLFVTAQVTTTGANVTPEQASRLVPFGVVVGFIAGLTLDAVFRKLIASDVVELGAVEAKKK